MINGNPRNAEEYFARATERRETRDFDGAIADYTEALRLDPDNIVALNDKGYTHNERSEFDEAIAILDRAILLKKKGKI